MSKGTIAITPRSLSVKGHPALTALERAGYTLIYPTPGKQPNEQELLAFLPECVGYLAGVEPISAAVLQQCPRLKVISRNGVGVDNVDLAAAAQLGIAVEKALNANSRGVAELAITLILSGLRHVSWSDAQIKAGKWGRKTGIELFGRTLGVVGCGQIGKQVVQMALGLGMSVRAYDLYPDAAFKPAGDFAYVSLQELFAQADIISLHAPPATQPLINADSLASLKNGVYLVNTARAALVDENALLAALESGKLRGYATDVYTQEPPQPSALLQHPNVLTTPHAGGLTEESIERATQIAVENLLKVLDATQ